MDSATTTSLETPAGVASLRRPDGTKETTVTVTVSNGHTDGEEKTYNLKKYRHVTAVHSQSRPSTLSHDATAPPSS